MEVLDLGEKIKRARIYKGYTLKDVCGNKLSVSKLSCIENGKVIPEDYLLEFISQKLDLELGYLKQDIGEQISININNLNKKEHNENFQSELKYNLKLAVQHKYIELAFDIMHKLFCHLLENKQFNSIQSIVNEYYDLQNQCNDADRINIFNMDIGIYSYEIKEYSQAVGYFNNLKKGLLAKKEKNYDFLAKAIFYEALSYIKIKDYDKAYDNVLILNKYIKYINEDIKKAEIYNMFAVLSLIKDKEQFNDLEQKTYKFYKDRDDKKAEAKFNFALIMFKKDIKDTALRYIKEALAIYPANNKEKFTDFLIKTLELLVNNEIYDEALKISDDALNNSISLDKPQFIERSYYFKSKLMMKHEQYISAEMYMNLSLEFLTKFGNNKDFYNRYLEMGNMYHDIGYIRESLRFFSLAISLKKKL